MEISGVFSFNFPLSLCILSYSLCVYAQLLQSCPSLWDPMGCDPPGISFHGILQARIPEQAGMTISSPNRQELLPHLQARAGVRSAAILWSAQHCLDGQVHDHNSLDQKIHIVLWGSFRNPTLSPFPLNVLISRGTGQQLGAPWTWPPRGLA